MIIDSLFLCTCYDKSTSDTKGHEYSGPDSLKVSKIEFRGYLLMRKSNKFFPISQEVLEEEKKEQETEESKKAEQFREELEETIEKNLVVSGELENEGKFEALGEELKEQLAEEIAEIFDL